MLYLQYFAQILCFFGCALVRLVIEHEFCVVGADTCSFLCGIVYPYLIWSCRCFDII